MTTISPQTLIRPALVLILSALAIKLAALFVWPVHLDSNYYLNIASNSIERGGLTPYMWRVPPDANIIAGSGTGYGILLQTGWLRIFGLSLLAGRALSYLAGVGLLIVMFAITRALYDGPAAWVTVAATAISTTFFSLLTLRMDALGYLAYALVLWVHGVAVQRKSWPLHALAGVLAIAATEVHILGTVYVFGLAFYYAVDFLRGWRRDGRIPWRHGAFPYYAGAFVAGLVYLWLRVLPNPDEYFLISRICRFCDTGSPARELTRHIVFGAVRPIETVLIVVAIVTAWRRRTPADQHWLMLAVGCLLAMGIISPPQIPVYTAHLLPVLMLGVGPAVIRGIGRGRPLPRWRLRAGVIVGVLVLVGYVGYVGWLATRPADADPRIAWVYENIPTDAVIVGYDGQFHALLDYPNFLSSSEDFGLEVGTTIRGETFTDVWNREQPVALLVDLDNVPSLREYALLRDFEEVLPDLWVSPTMR